MTVESPRFESLFLFLDSFEEAVFVFDDEARVQHINKAAGKFLDLPSNSEQLLMKSLLPEERNVNYWKSFKSLLENARSNRSEHVSVLVEICGATKCIHLRGRLTVLCPDGQASYAILVLPIFGISPELSSSPPATGSAETSRSEFIGMAVHDLRTPLHKISLACEVLGADDVPAEKRTSFISMIRRAAEGMGDLINDLLDLTKIEAGKVTLKKENLPFGKYLSSICKESKLLAEEKNIQFQVNIAEDSGELEFDPKRIGQVMNNLLSNAFKFSQSGSEVRVQTRKFDGGIEVSVSDNGPGISSEDIPKLFDAFSKSKNRPTGGEQSTGLGLAICRKIVELHGGVIGVDSEENKGSRFYFTLPCS